VKERTRPSSGSPAIRGLSFGAAVHLLGSKQKPSYGAPAYSRFVNRPIGRYFAAAAYKAGLRPNAVTMISGLFSLSAVVLIATVPPSWLSGIAICLGLVLGYAFDSADGQLARLLGGGSPSGEWLDHMVDATKISSLHLAVLIGFYRFGGWPGPGWMLVPIGYAVVAAVTFFGMTLMDQLRTVHTGAAKRAQTGRPSLIRSILVLPTDYGLLCLSFLLFAWQQAFVTVYTVFFIGSAIFLVLALMKWFRETKALG
jgi:phosphatidylglycerophosphate synthase